MDTVIESAPIETRVGTFSAVGSYRRLDGQKLNEFDAVTDSVSEEEIDEGVRFVMYPFFLLSQHLPLEEALGLTPTRVETGIMV